MRISYHDFLSFSLSPLSSVSRVPDYCSNKTAFQFKAKWPLANRCMGYILPVPYHMDPYLLGPPVNRPTDMVENNTFLHTSYVDGKT